MNDKEIIEALIETVKSLGGVIDAQNEIITDLTLLIAREIGDE